MARGWEGEVQARKNSNSGLLSVTSVATAVLLETFGLAAEDIESNYRLES